MLRSTAIADEADEGQRLRKLRNSSGLSQARLAKIAGVGRHTVSRWENKQRFHRQSRSLKSILAVLELLHRYTTDQTRARGYGVLLDPENKSVKLAAIDNAKGVKFQKKKTAPSRVKCEAKTRNGTPCRLRSELGKRRCKFHGGKSTGPKTNAGRSRISEAQRWRWKEFRRQKSIQSKRSDQFT